MTKSYSYLSKYKCGATTTLLFSLVPWQYNTFMMEKKEIKFYTKKDEIYNGELDIYCINPLFLLLFSAIVVYL